MNNEFEDLFEFAPVAYVTLDRNGAIVLANLAATSLLGHETEQLIGRALVDYVDPAWRTAFEAHLVATLSGEPEDCQLKMGETHGRDHMVFLQSSPMIDDDMIVGCRSMLADISELQQTQQQLLRHCEALETVVNERNRQMDAFNRRLIEESERHRAASEELRRERDFNVALLDTARTVVLVLDTNGCIVSFNRYMEEISGYKLNEVRGKDWFTTFLPQRERAFINDLFRESIQGSRVKGRTNAIVTRSGDEREIEWYDAELNSPDGQFVGLLCTGQDVTERRTLQEQLLTISEAEQQRIGEHLHDDLGQELVALRLSVDTLLEGLKSENSAETDRCVRIASGLARVTRNLRELSRGLIQLVVGARDFRKVLGDLCRQLSEFEEVHCDYDCDVRLNLTDDQTANQLYYIAKEALTNALKHGRVDGLWTNVNVRVEDGNIVLTVRDNGVGVPGDVQNSRGSGLHLMRYRAELIGASLRIEKHPDGGTVVTCMVPRDPARLAEYTPLSSL